MVHTEAQFGT